MQAREDHCLLSDFQGAFSRVAMLLTWRCWFGCASSKFGPLSLRTDNPILPMYQERLPVSTVGALLVGPPPPEDAPGHDPPQQGHKLSRAHTARGLPPSSRFTRTMSSRLPPHLQPLPQSGTLAAAREHQQTARRPCSWQHPCSAARRFRSAAPGMARCHASHRRVVRRHERPEDIPRRGGGRGPSWPESGRLATMARRSALWRAGRPTARREITLHAAPLDRGRRRHIGGHDAASGGKPPREVSLHRQLLRLGVHASAGGARVGSVGAPLRVGDPAVHAAPPRRVPLRLEPSAAGHPLRQAQQRGDPDRHRGVRQTTVGVRASPRGSTMSRGLRRRSPTSLPRFTWRSALPPRPPAARTRASQALRQGYLPLPQPHRYRRHADRSTSGCFLSSSAYRRCRNPRRQEMWLPQEGPRPRPTTCV